MILIKFGKFVGAYRCGLLTKVSHQWKRVKRKAYYAWLLAALRHKQKVLNRELHKKYYPIIWRQQCGLAAEDVSAYLTYEGKGKIDSIDLLDKFYQSWKDIHARMTIYTTISLIITSYIASYAIGIKLPVSWQGIELKYDPTVLSVLLTFGAYLGLRATYALGHQLILRSAMNALIEHSFDPQLGNTLKSVYLYDTNTPYYSCASNPKLILTKPFTNILGFSGILALVVLILVPLILIYINIEAMKLLYNAPSPYFEFHLLLITITLGFSVTSLSMLLIICMPLRYKDWSTNSKYEILKQIDPVAHDNFRREMYRDITRNEHLIEAVRARLKQ